MLLKKRLFVFFLPVMLLINLPESRAQFSTGTDNTNMNLFQQADSNNVDSTNKGWKEVEAKIYFTTLNSEVHRNPDSSIQHFQRFEPVYPWWGINLGNYGTATRSLYFQPETNDPGLSSGYNVFDFYEVNLDSLRFYNTTNPYSDFRFVLGSKNQQIVSLTHTQNITPNWNFAGNIKATSSQGFYTGQTSKNIQGSLNTNYSSQNQRYKLKAAFIYNHFSQDENGGIQSDSFLTLSNFNDRSRIPVNIPVLYSGRDQSPVNNQLRDVDFYIQNNYSWGQTDTNYNKDSTHRTVTFVPRFRLQHELRIHSEKHLYNDYLPDSARYLPIAPLSFGTQDSLFGRQKWSYIDNRLSLNGFLGKDERLMQIKAGMGNRIDRFSSLTPSGYAHDNSFNTYLFGSIRKEAFQQHQWFYNADAQLYITGQALGDFKINAQLQKQLNDWLGFDLGFHQSLTNAPYLYEHFSSNYFDFSQAFKKTSNTKLSAGITIPKLKLNVVGNYIMISNYLYFDSNLQPQQESSLIPLLQIYVQKPINFHNFTLDNKFLYQQNQANSVISVPKLMAMEQLSYHNDIFKGALSIETGIEVSYTTNYYCYDYSPLVNQFFYQDTYQTNNLPQLNAFFNFQLHHFRAFLSLSDVQQLLYKNTINTPGYPSENMMFRLGFSWVLIN